MGASHRRWSQWSCSCKPLLFAFALHSPGRVCRSVTVFWTSFALAGGEVRPVQAGPAAPVKGVGTLVVVLPKRWFWFYLSCQLVVSRAAVSHGPRLVPRRQADTARATKRDELELPHGRAVLPATQKRRDFLLEQFSSWLKGHDMALDEILMAATPSRP